jgi:hypothetical protein
MIEAHTFRVSRHNRRHAMRFTLSLLSSVPGPGLPDDFSESLWCPSRVSTPAAGTDGGSVARSRRHTGDTYRARFMRAFALPLPASFSSPISRTARSTSSPNDNSNASAI